MVKEILGRKFYKENISNLKKNLIFLLEDCTILAVTVENKQSTRALHYYSARALHLICHSTKFSVVLTILQNKQNVEFYFF